MLVRLACDLLLQARYMYLAHLWPPLGLRGGLSLPRRAQLLRRFGRWFCAIDARVLAIGLGCRRITGAAAAAEPFGARAAAEREAAATAVGRAAQGIQYPTAQRTRVSSSASAGGSIAGGKTPH